MATINPYLNFNGNTEEAFNFYKSVFGGELLIFRFKDSQEEHTQPGSLDKIMHVSLPIGKGNVLMGTDVLESQGHKLTSGNNFQLSLAAESEAEADKLFQALSAGGTILVPIGKSSWNAYFGMFIDKFGIHWMVNYDYNQ